MAVSPAQVLSVPFADPDGREIWTGIGTLGSFAVGLCVLDEAASPLRMLAVALIVAGLVLMKFASP